LQFAEHGVNVMRAGIEPYWALCCFVSLLSSSSTHRGWHRRLARQYARHDLQKCNQNTNSSCN